MSSRGGGASRYGWYLLALGGLTAALGVAMPTMAMPVLFAEIAGDLGLTIVQIGAVWGTVSLAGMFVSLLGGSLGDRFGARRTLTIACLGLGIAGALRGLSSNLATLTLTVFAAGLFSGIVPMNLHKVCGVWFSGKRLGLANGVISASMALGFTLGAMVSATVLSPWLGSWRGVLLFYGGIALLLAIPWGLSRDESTAASSTHHGAAGHATIRQSLVHVIRLPSVWLLGIALLAVGGAIQGFLGYLPLYLRDIGWEPSHADMALSSFHAVSLACVLPIAFLSDRFRLRRSLLAAAIALTAAGIGVVSLAQGLGIWVGVLIAGAVRDSYMAVFMTTVTEIPGAGAIYAGTALGLVMTLLRIGGLVAPPLGNAMVAFGPRSPFILWAAMAAVGLIALAGEQALRRADIR